MPHWAQFIELDEYVDEQTFHVRKRPEAVPGLWPPQHGLTPMEQLHALEAGEDEAEANPAPEGERE